MNKKLEKPKKGNKVGNEKLKRRIRENRIRYYRMSKKIEKC